jgi:hypothetical protein
VHPIGVRYAFTDTGRDTPFLLAFYKQHGLSDPDGSKTAEMMAFAESLGREGRLLEGPIEVREILFFDPV